MPSGGVWPPKGHERAYLAYRDWDAWYVGDAARLREVYTGRGSDGRPLPPSQWTPGGGGLFGRISRWLWGAPQNPNARDGRLHVPLPADLAASVSRLLFAEPPKLTCDDPASQARLEQLAEDGLHQVLLAAAEAASALGDVYLRPTIDQEVMPGRAFLTPIHADGAIPVMRWGRLTEVTFHSLVHIDGREYWRLLEHHSAGLVEYALFRGSPVDLGVRMPVQAHPTTAAVAGDLKDGVQYTGLNRLAVVRIRNTGPQRAWRNEPCLKYHGRSDFDGAEPLFDRFDAVWTSWMRDIHLARGRIMVPAQYLDSNGPGQGATFDADREVYTTLQAMPKDMTGSGITLSQFAIRHVEHKATLDEIRGAVLLHVALSEQTVGQEGDMAVTATEIESRERLSFANKGARGGEWTTGAADAVEVLTELEYAQFGTTTPFRPYVQMSDGVSESLETVARTVQLLHAAESISLETRVRRVNPDWDDDQVKDEVARIREDQAGGPVELAPPPADTLGALAGNEPPPAAGAGAEDGDPDDEEATAA